MRSGKVPEPYLREWNMVSDCIKIIIFNSQLAIFDYTEASSQGTNDERRYKSTVYGVWGAYLFLTTFLCLIH